MSLEAPYLRSYREYDGTKDRFNLVLEAVFEDQGCYVSFPADNIDILEFIMMIKMLANAVGRTLVSTDE